MARARWLKARSEMKNDITRAPGLRFRVTSNRLLLVPLKPKREQTRHGPDRSMPLAITAVRRVGRADKVSFRPRLLYPAFFYGPRGSGAHHRCMVNRSSKQEEMPRPGPTERAGASE
jgi:hypothetical protein